MTDRGAGCWESRLSGSERGWSATLDMDEILWHRRETRRQTENTNNILCRGESPAYSNTVQRAAGPGCPFRSQSSGMPFAGDYPQSYADVRF